MGSDLARFARQTILPGFGERGQQAVGAARVLLIGAGGLGSTAIPVLAAAGVGSLTIVDDDVVDETNLARQTLFAPTDVGAPKALLAAREVERLNPDIQVIPVVKKLSRDNALELFAAADIVLDCSDNFATRYLVVDAATITDIPVVWGAMHQFAGQIGVSWMSRGPGYRDLFPVPPQPDAVESCAVAGVLSSLCAVIGGLMATETLKILTGLGEPLVGRVTTFDALTGVFREIRFERDPDAEPVTELIDYEEFCGVKAPTPHFDGSITATQLKELIDSGAPVRLVDVREPWETELVSLTNDLALPFGDVRRDPESARAQLAALEGTVVAYCHHGPRSDWVRDLAADQTEVLSLEGGIDAWSRLVDPAVRRY